MLHMTVGTDLVEVERFQRVLTERAPRLGERLFTERDWAYCQTRARPDASLAARFTWRASSQRGTLDSRLRPIADVSITQENFMNSDIGGAGK